MVEGVERLVCRGPEDEVGASPLVTDAHCQLVARGLPKECDLETVAGAAVWSHAAAKIYETLTDHLRTSFSTARRDFAA